MKVSSYDDDALIHHLAGRGHNPRMTPAHPLSSSMPSFMVDLAVLEGISNRLLCSRRCRAVSFADDRTVMRGPAWPASDWKRNSAAA